MAKCRKCGGWTDGRRLCSSCISKFTENRTKNWKELTELFGGVTKENLSAIQKEMKKRDLK